MIQQRTSEDPKKFIGAICVAYSEVLDGRRSPEQVSRWLSEDCYLELSRKTKRANAIRGTSNTAKSNEFFRFRKVALFPGAKSCIESVVLMQSKDRVRTIAAKLQPIYGKWRITEIWVF